MTIPHVNCDVCNIILNSKSTYDQHISGSKHKKKAQSLGLTLNQSAQTVPIQQNEKPTCIKLPIQEIIGPSKQLSQYNCDICNLNLQSKDQLDSHLSGKKHMKKLNQPQKTTNNDNSNFNCELCSIKLCSKDQLDSHLSGKKHLKKLTSLSKIAQISIGEKKLKQDESKFENMNIAWDKYKISDLLRAQTENKYEFYCELCNKYVQRKLQLVDHLKSKKHHRKIHEKRYKDKGLIPPSQQQRQQIKTNVGKYTKKINFVPANSGVYNTISNYQMQPNYNTNKRKLEQNNGIMNNSKRQAVNGINTNYYGYGYDYMNNNSNNNNNNNSDVGNFYWKTPMSVNDRQDNSIEFNQQYLTQQFQQQQQQQNDNVQNDSFKNFVYNVVSNQISSLQYATAMAGQNYQQNNKKF